MYLCTWGILCPVSVDLHVIPLSVITLWDAAKAMLSEPHGSLLTTLFPLLLPVGARKLGRAFTFTLHTLYYAHTAPCTHPPIHTVCARAEL